MMVAVVTGERADGLRIDELVRELPMAAEVTGDVAVRVRGVRHDSRDATIGDVFVARPGQNVDGVAFIDDAIARGAAAIVGMRGSVDARRIRVPLILVDDPAAALAYVASAVYGQPSFSLDVVGITGTNGKTTTAHLTRAAIDCALGTPSCGVIGTVGHSFGGWSLPAANTTPEADDVARVMAAMRDRGATHVAMEVSSHALALGRARALRFRVAALTNISQDHLDFHGSMSAYVEAKARLFVELGPGSAVVNVGDARGRELAALTRAPLVRVAALTGAGPADAEIAPREVRLDAGGVRAVIRTPAGDVQITSRLIGAHNLENLLVALGIAHALELDLGRAADGLSREPAPPGRLERCDSEEDDVLVLVDYAHTPDALVRVLEAVRRVTPGRLWCVFGCGGDRDSTKRGPMGRAVARGADVAVLTSDNPRTEDPRAIAREAADGARAGGLEPVVELDRRAAIDLAVASARPGDAILIAGKGHEDVQVVGTTKHPFDDRVEARRALEARRYKTGMR
jgi:UDP-N-acetylmuramoyl-L-alanyl-D-glutamate--2,6-diaminopimelate ligase